MFLSTLACLGVSLTKSISYSLFYIVLGTAIFTLYFLTSLSITLSFGFIMLLSRRLDRSLGPALATTTLSFLTPLIQLLFKLLDLFLGLLSYLIIFYFDLDF